MTSIIWNELLEILTNATFIPLHEDIKPCIHFQHYWPVVIGFRWSPVDSPHKGPVTRTFDFLLPWTNRCTNSRFADWTTRHSFQVTVNVHQRTSNTGSTERLKWHFRKWSCPFTWSAPLPCLLKQFNHAASLLSFKGLRKFTLEWIPESKCIQKMTSKLVKPVMCILHQFDLLH